MADGEFVYAQPLLVIAGKGGVGKTVLTAALGNEAASAGHSTLLVEVAGNRQIPRLFGVERPQPTDQEHGIAKLAEHLEWVSLRPERLLAGWLSGRSMGAIARRLESSGALEIISSSIPGIKDALVLGQIRSWIDADRWDRIIVDGPASGRAREMLRAPQLLAAAASDGPIAAQANQAHAMLTDPEQSSLLLVTLAEETPINETIETGFDVEDDPGMTIAGVVVNRRFPAQPPPRAKHPMAAVLQRRFDTAEVSLRRLRDELPLDVRFTHELPGGVGGPDDLRALLHPAAGTELSTESLDWPAEDGAVDQLLERDVVVTVGTGGVGKTSIGAALAARAARSGRRVALITIDPARRLADALGLEELDDDLHPIDIGGSGSLAASMLDPEATFARVVRTHAESEEQASAILDSPLSSQLAESLSGMTEYMAVERLHELTTSGDHDLVVVDTPPSADALAFLDAPDLLARLLDNRIYKLLVHGNKGIVERTLRTLVNQLISIVGGAVVRDAVAFFQNFDGLEPGFRARGQEMKALLRSDRTSFVIVAAPTETSLRNADTFLQQLADDDVAPELMVVNRCTTDPGPSSRSPALNEMLDHLRARRRHEIESVSGYERRLPTVLVDELADGVTSLDDVSALADSLG